MINGRVRISVRVTHIVTVIAMTEYDDVALYRLPIVAVDAGVALLKAYRSRPPRNVIGKLPDRPLVFICGEHWQPHNCSTGTVNGPFINNITSELPRYARTYVARQDGRIAITNLTLSHDEIRDTGTYGHQRFFELDGERYVMTHEADHGEIDGFRW